MYSVSPNFSCVYWIAFRISAASSWLIGFSYTFVFICLIRIIISPSFSDRQFTGSVRVSDILVPSIWWMTISLAVCSSVFTRNAFNLFNSSSEYTLNSALCVGGISRFSMMVSICGYRHSFPIVSNTALRRVSSARNCFALRSSVFR